MKSNRTPSRLWKRHSTHNSIKRSRASLSQRYKINTRLDMSFSMTLIKVRSIIIQPNWGTIIRSKKRMNNRKVDLVTDLLGGLRRSHNQGKESNKRHLWRVSLKFNISHLIQALSTTLLTLRKPTLRRKITTCMSRIWTFLWKSS